MSTFRSMLTAAVLATSAAGLALPAAAQSTCEWYARTAVRQQQENEQRKCGFKGDAWNTDLKAHLTWCATVTPDTWRKSAQKRDQDLAACAAKR